LTMGYKDDKWREAPGYCVECDNLRPLSAAGVCRECCESGPLRDEEWEEEERASQLYYHRTSPGSTFSPAKAPYIFITDEGFTFQPGSEAACPDVDNLQVLGIAYGQDAEDALAHLLAQQPWIRETAFSRAFCWALAPDFRRRVREFSLR
jgi:hypothetical protein